MKSWYELFSSPNKQIRIRAARGLLSQGSKIPLPLILKILDDFSDEGLGGEAERVLFARRDPELLGEMICRLRSPSEFVREVACKAIGQFGNATNTELLLEKLNDPGMMVRRAAVLALARIGSPNSAPELLHQYKAVRDEAGPLRCALEFALRQLKVEYESDR